MDFENFTDRARGFIQSAQTLALRNNHQQLTPLHVLKVLLEDKEGLAANLIDRLPDSDRNAIRLITETLAMAHGVDTPSVGERVDG